MGRIEIDRAMLVVKNHLRGNKLPGKVVGILVSAHGFKIALQYNVHPCVIGWWEENLREGTMASCELISVALPNQGSTEYYLMMENREEPIHAVRLTDLEYSKDYGVYDAQTRKWQA